MPQSNGQHKAQSSRRLPSLSISPSDPGHIEFGRWSRPPITVRNPPPAVERCVGEALLLLLARLHSASCSVRLTPDAVQSAVLDAGRLFYIPNNFSIRHDRCQLTRELERHARDPHKMAKIYNTVPPPEFVPPPCPHHSQRSSVVLRKAGSSPPPRASPPRTSSRASPPRRAGFRSTLPR